MRLAIFSGIKYTSELLHLYQQRYLAKVRCGRHVYIPPINLIATLLYAAVTFCGASGYLSGALWLCTKLYTVLVSRQRNSVQKAYARLLHCIAAAANRTR